MNEALPASQEEIAEFLKRPDASTYTDARRVQLQVSVSDVARLAFIVLAAQEAVPNDPFVGQLAFQLRSIVAEQVSIIICQIKANTN